MLDRAHKAVRWSRLWNRPDGCGPGDRSARGSQPSGLLYALLLVAAGCASLPPVPSAGGPHWLRLESEHSVLLTDAPAAQAVQTSARIEQQHGALCRVAFPCDATQRAQKLRVIALHDADQLELLYGADVPAVFTPELVYAPLLVLSNGLSDGGMAQLSRALTGLVAQQGLGPLPPWLRQGLASYLETAHYDVAGAFVIGDPVRRYVEQLHAQPRLGTSALLNLPASAPEPPMFAASAWLVVHYLMSERRADFAAFRASLASGQTLAAAFHEAFPDLSPEQLDGLLDRYAGAANFLTQSKRFESPATPSDQRALDDADVYSLRAEIAALCRDCDARARERSSQQLRLALEREPNHLRANVLQALTQPPGPTRLANEAARAQALTQAHPEAPLAWVHLGYADPAQACSPTRLQRLRELAPHDAHALSQRAQCELRVGRRDSALALSRLAFAAYPISPRITAAHMHLLRDAGACEALERLQERGAGAMAGPSESRAPARAPAGTATPASSAPCVTQAANDASASTETNRPR